MEGVVKVVLPVVSALPPVAAAYQSIVSPTPGVADIVIVPVPHLAAPLPPGADGRGFTVAVTAVLVADTQPVVVFLASA